MTNRPLVTTSRNYEKQVSDLGEPDDCVDDKVIVDKKSMEKRSCRSQPELPPKVPSTDDTVEDDEDEDEEGGNDNENDTGYRMSVEAHLLKDEWHDEDSLETMEETSVRSWKSFRSWNQRRQRIITPTPSSPRVEVYVDIAEDSTLVPKMSPASAIRSSNNIHPPGKQDLAHLLAAVPSTPEAEAPSASDAFSIQSQSVFTRDDFAKSDWLSVMTTNSGYVGLGVIALTISVTHPIMFMAAALTALGTATAVGASYDCFLQMVPCCTTDQTLSSEETESDGIKGTVTKTFEGGGRPRGVNGTYDPPRTTVVATSTETPIRQILPSKSAINLGWIDARYPPLDFAVIENQALDGLNVVQFFDVFFSDTAPYNFRDFQIQRGDKNVEYGTWKQVQDTSMLSMHPAAGRAPADLEYRSWIERELHFQAKTNNTFLGPPYATTTKEQRCLIFSKKMGVLEMRTTLADIPFCDRFYVLERWILTAAKDGAGIYHLQISSSASVVLTKSCPFATQIQTKSRSSLTDVGRAWCHMAKQALQLAQQAKIDRLQHNEQDDDEEEDEDDDDEEEEEL